MVAMLIPLLAASAGGYVGKSLMDDWIQDRRQAQEGAKMGGILDSVGGTAAGPDATAEALARGGMLGTDAGRGLMQYGFGQQGAATDQGYALDRIGAQGAETRRNMGYGSELAQEEARFRQQLDQQAAQALRDAEIKRAQDTLANPFSSPDTLIGAAKAATDGAKAKVLESLGLESPEVRQARIDRDMGVIEAGRSGAQEMANIQGMLDTVSSLPNWAARNLPGGGSAGRVLSDAETLTQRAAFDRQYEQAFGDWKRQVYGEAEPSPATLDRLREAFGDPYGGADQQEGFVRNMRLLQAEAKRRQDYAVSVARLKRGDYASPDQMPVRSPDLTDLERRAILGDESFSALEAIKNARARIAPGWSGDGK